MSDDLNNVTVSVGYLTPQTHWEARHEMFDNVRKSRRAYMSLSEDRQRVLKDKVRGTLAVMLDRVDEWIPDAFEGEKVGESLDIKISLVMADIDSSIVADIESSSMKLNEAKDLLVDHITDLELGESDES